MKVLVLSSLFPSQTRPIFGVFVRERLRQLATLCDIVVVAPVPWFPGNRWLRGHAVATTPWIERDERFTVYHPRVLSFPGLGKSLDAVLYALSVLPIVGWLRYRFAFDAVDAEFGYPDGVAAVLLGKLFRRRVAITLRGDEARLLQHRLRRAQVRWALQHAQGIAVSNAQRQIAAQLGLNPESIRVIPNGVDTSRFRPSDRRAARTRLGLPHDRIILLGVGAMIERKGHHRLLALLPALVRDQPGLLYVVIGDAEHASDYPELLARLVSEHGLHDHVQFVPVQPHDEILHWLAAADLFCLATSHEGWCNAITEALACGLPVVSTRVGGNREIVQDGADGFLVPYWDADAFAAAIRAALAHPWDRVAISARARRRSWEDAARELSVILQHE